MEYLPGAAGPDFSSVMRRRRGHLSSVIIECKTGSARQGGLERSETHHHGILTYTVDIMSNEFLKPAAPILTPDVGFRFALTQPTVLCFPGYVYVIGQDSQFMHIGDMGVGGYVLSQCEKTGKREFKRVIRKFEHDSEHRDIKIYEIKYITELGEELLIDSTAEHPFWVNGKGWVKAIDLKPGQMLEICDPTGESDVNRPEGKKCKDFALGERRWQAKVLEVAYCYDSGIVHNIEVEDFHTYFVGVHGILVHSKPGRLG